MLRDFTYLDAERMRSFAAQLLQGVPDSSTADRSRELGGKAGAEAGLWNFVRGQGEADYRYRRSDSETRSLHHHVYTLFEEALAQQGLLTVVDDEFDYSSWTPDLFKDGQFVKVRGTVRTINYAELIQRIEFIPKLWKTLQAIETVNIKSSLQAGNIGQQEASRRRQSAAATANEMKALPVKEIAALGEELYAPGEIRVKVSPRGAPHGHVLVGTGRQEGFFNEGSSLTVIGGSSARGDWLTVGQIAGSEKAGGLMPTGNAIEDGLEEMALGFEEFSRIVSAAAFPAMAFTPLAVYRQIT